jgi:fatty acid desaturase
MEDKANLIESLLDKAIDYGKTSFEVIKLNTVDKASDVVSSGIPHSIVFIFIASFMLFFNLGLAFWLGEILGNTYFGFFLVAAFYAILGIVLHFFMHQWLKNIIYNYIIKQVLK